MDELYNKRQSSIKQIFNQNKDAYNQRHHYDHDIAQIQKRKNDGERGRVPWGTGFQAQAQLTSSSQIGGHYNNRR